MSGASSRIPAPRGGIPIRLMGGPSANTRRRSMSVPDLSTVGTRPAAPPGQRSMRTATGVTGGPLRNATSTTSLTRKRPPPTELGSSKGTQAPKRPLVQVAANKRPVTSAVSKQAPFTSKQPLQTGANALGKRKVAAWDTKGQLELANSKIQRLQEEKENLHAATARAQELSEQLKIAEKSLCQTQEELLTAKEKIKVNEGLSARNAQMQEEIQKLDTRCKDYKEQITGLTTQLLKANQEFEICNSKFNKLQRDYDLLTQKHKDSEENCEKYLNKIFELEQLRRIHLNAILDLKGNIRVFCRVRPPLESEQGKNMCTFSFPDEGTLQFMPVQDASTARNASKRQEPDRSFTYDKVFPPSASQEDIYLELSQLVQSALDGYNICIFAYGQTGSGKTFTMEGGLEQGQEGMIPRSVKTIFNSILEQEKLGWKYTVTCSFMEIYNENIKDLLNPNSNLSYDLKMSESNPDDVVVSNLIVKVITNEMELQKLLGQAQRNRSTASTVMNERSSRSHSITQLKIVGYNEARKLECLGTLNLIDLAGSEKYRIENGSHRNTETCNINKSLSTLSRVVLNLAEKAEFIPFRDSKLTHLLMPSLKGNSKTLMMVNISPFEDCQAETIGSLRFASRVATVKLSVRKQVKSGLSRIPSTK